MRILPFGLSSTCYISTKVILPSINRWRGMGLASILYLEYGINSKPDHAMAHVAVIWRILV